MYVFRRFFIKLTPTRDLLMSSGKFETLFFESVYRVTYITGLATNEISWLYFIYGSAVKLTLILLMSGEIGYGLTANISLDERVSCINTCLLQILSLYRYMNMIDNQSAYKELAASMESPYFDTSTPQRKKLLSYWAKKNEKYLKLLIGLGYCTLVAWYIYPLVDDIEYNLIIGTYIPFAYNTPVMYPCAFISLAIAFWYIAHFVMIVDVTMQAHLIHLLCQFSVLGDCFENLLEDCRVGFEGIPPNYLINNNEFANKYTKRMGDLVEQHKLILRFTAYSAKMETIIVHSELDMLMSALFAVHHKWMKSYDGINELGSHAMNLRNSLSRPMLFQFMASGTLICFVGYTTIMTLTESVAKTVNSIFFLSFNIFELFVICRWCDEIRVQSLNIGEAIYCCGWENGLSVLPGIKQTVKLVIARSNKPLAFTAGGMYELSLASFSNLVKTSYSALTVVLRMSQHK